MMTDVPSVERDSPAPRGRPIFAAGFVILLSVVLLYIVLSLVPRSSVVFQDVDPGQPLPSLTATVIQYRWVFASFAYLGPLVAFFALLYRTSSRFLVAMLVLLLLQIAVTTIAFFLPILSISFHL